MEPAPFPLVSKARTIGDEDVTLLPLNVDRHFDVLFQDVVADSGLPYDHPFWDKVPKVRGQSGAWSQSARTDMMRTSAIGVLAGRNNRPWVGPHNVYAL